MPSDFVKYYQPTNADRNVNLVDPEEKGSLVATSKAINTDWFAANIEPTNSPAVHRLQIRLASASIVKVVLDDGVTTNLEMDLNAGSALGAGQLYVFDIMLLPGQSYNIQHESTTQNIFCSVVEINKFV